MNSQENSKPPISTREKLLNIILIIAIILCVVAISLRIFIFSKIEVREESMSPTYAEFDTFWISKIQPITRGCVAVFYKYNVQGSIFDGFLSSSGDLLVKRIVAVGGDKIWAELKDVDGDGNETFTIKIWCFDTGEIIDETNYFRGDKHVEIPPINSNWLGFLAQHVGQDKSYEIPQGNFFAMGDNRNVSLDSRNLLGPVPVNRLLGVALN